MAQNVDIGGVDVNAQGAQPANSHDKNQISDAGTVGSNAPAGSAPALAPAQANLQAAEPGSIISDKVIQDIANPSGDYNEAAKFSPGFYVSNPTGTGDATSGWRGFADGQFNITYDGIPFGDANDPSHHSKAYFPSPFIGSEVVDRSPGAASQVGYATFGGTLSLMSHELTDKMGGNIQTSYGNFNTFSTSGSIQSGILPWGGRLLAQFSHQNSDGVLIDGKTQGDFGLLKYEQPLGDFDLTAFATFGQERYNNTNGITYAQWQQFGKSYAGLGNNPALNTYTGYNNSAKQTDMEYLKLKGHALGFAIDNTLYTYAYNYPRDQNNGLDQTVEGPATLSKVKIPQLNGTKITVPVIGVGPTDVSGHLQLNNYRAFGDIIKLKRDVNAGWASGQLRTGLWLEHVDNFRFQPYIDYTKGLTYTQLGNPANVANKLQLNSHIDNFQPFVEYEWKPTDQLSITPGFKFEAFRRTHDAAVNQKTLAPLYYTHTYYGSLPFLTVRYKINEQTTVYAQASRGMLAPLVAAYYVFNPSENTIKPQTTDNFQIGAAYKSGKITADVDAYLIKAAHFSSTYTDPTGTVYFKDGGNATYQGVEGELSYSLYKGLSLYGSGSFGSAKYTGGVNGGLAIGGAPSLTAAGGVIYDDGHVFGSLLAKVVGSSYGTQGSDQVAGFTVNKVKSYSTTDAVLGYRADLDKKFGALKKFEIKTGVNNLFNSRAITDISGTPATNDPTTAGLVYNFLPSRTFYVSAKVDF
ncbi:MAG: TonB-dependent receptor [Hyphomicrobiales bacterium]|nr:TonB-dependent receptor [Hyphomicrobiales bacterium]MDE2114578.1 TonB-dependent receptor [Hyphomicrobiales bacterium]